MGCLLLLMVWRQLVCFHLEGVALRVDWLVFDRHVLSERCEVGSTSHRCATPPTTTSVLRMLQ